MRVGTEQKSQDRIGQFPPGSTSSSVAKGMLLEVTKINKQNRIKEAKRFLLNRGGGKQGKQAVGKSSRLRMKRSTV